MWCCAYLCLTECYLCAIPHYLKRVELREKYGLPEDERCGDLPATICCSPCAVCQEARFLKHRGIFE
jgi:Cys-rich protein (TIGR01571 family)